MEKAYDQINRKQLFKFLESRAKTRLEKHVVETVKIMYKN